MRAPCSIVIGLVFVFVSRCSATETVVAAGARRCTQEERQLVNQLQQQNKEPAKSCYAEARGDITTLATNRLCPLSECEDWLAYMAANAPDCYYDSTNYATSYALKSADCSASSSSSSKSASASASASKSAEGSTSAEGSESLASSGSMNHSASMDEERSINSTSVDSSLDGSEVGDMSMASAASEEIELEVTETPTTSADEDLSIDTAPSKATDSSSSSSSSTTSDSSTSTASSVSARTLFATMAFVFAATAGLAP